MKIKLYLFIFIFSSFLFIEKVHAISDVSIKVSKGIEYVNNVSKSAVEELRSIENFAKYEIDFNGVIKMKPEFLTVKNLPLSLPKGMEDVNNISNLEESIDDQLFIKGDDLDSSRKHDNFIEELKRDKASRLYGESFSVITNISSEDLKVEDRKDTQAMLLATNAKRKNIGDREAKKNSLLLALDEFTNIGSLQSQASLAEKDDFDDFSENDNFEEDI